MSVEPEKLEDYRTRLQPFITLTIFASLMCLWILVLTFLPLIVVSLGWQEEVVHNCYLAFDYFSKIGGGALAIGLTLSVAQAVLGLWSSRIKRIHKKKKDAVAV